MLNYPKRSTRNEIEASALHRFFNNWQRWETVQNIIYSIENARQDLVLIDDSKNFNVVYEELEKATNYAEDISSDIEDDILDNALDYSFKREDALKNKK